jgi:hypothetical protein
MELEALPYTVLLIMTEFSVGSLTAVLLSDARGLAPASFVRLSAALVVAGAALALLAGVNASDSAFGSYQLNEGLYTPVRVTLAVFLVLTFAYLLLTLRDRRLPSLQVGGLAAATGIVALGLMSYQISPPAWSFAGVLLSVFAGTLALGLVSESMVLGHWYLVTPRLPGRPLIELTALLMVALAGQAVLLVLNAAVPADQVPETSAALAGSLGTNAAFWLRTGVGLAFPLALSWMAWVSSREHSMMSATGLLYIAVGAVFVGEVLARGILFVTGAPV